MKKYKLKNKKIYQASFDSIKKKDGETIVLPLRSYSITKNCVVNSFLSFMSVIITNSMFFSSLEGLTGYDKGVFLKTMLLSACFLGFGVLIFGSIAFFLISLFRLIFAWRVRSQEVVLSTYPLRIGESYDIKFRLRMWGWSNLKRVKVNSSIINEECVTYPPSGSRTYSVTQSHKHWDFEFPEVILSRVNNSYEGSIQLNIPEESTMPSIYSSRHNKIQWRLRLKWSLPNFGDECTPHVIKILPKREKQ